jgi:hypothetical protein
MALVHEPFTQTQTPLTETAPFVDVPRPTSKPRHVKVTGHRPAFGYEPCEDIGCTVDGDGIATSCGRAACPNCGYGGANVTMMLMVGGTELHARCTCGHMWTPGQKPVYVVTRAETAECTCPDACERDHSND